MPDPFFFRDVLSLVENQSPKLAKYIEFPPDNTWRRIAANTISQAELGVIIIREEYSSELRQIASLLFKARHEARINPLEYEQPNDVSSIQELADSMEEFVKNNNQRARAEFNGVSLVLVPGRMADYVVGYYRGYVNGQSQTTTK